MPLIAKNTLLIKPVYDVFFTALSQDHNSHLGSSYSSWSHESKNRIARMKVYVYAKTVI